LRKRGRLPLKDQLLAGSGGRGGEASRDTYVVSRRAEGGDEWGNTAVPPGSPGGKGLGLTGVLKVESGGKERSKKIRMGG